VAEFDSFDAARQLSNSDDYFLFTDRQPFLGGYFLAVTWSVILSYSVFGRMCRVTSSPGSL